LKEAVRWSILLTFLAGLVYAFLYPEKIRSFAENHPLVTFIAFPAALVVLIAVGSHLQSQGMKRWLAKEAAALGGRFLALPDKLRSESDTLFRYREFGGRVEGIGEFGACVSLATLSNFSNRKSTRRMVVELPLSTAVPGLLLSDTRWDPPPFPVVSSSSSSPFIFSESAELVRYLGAGFPLEAWRHSFNFEAMGIGSLLSFDTLAERGKLLIFLPYNILTIKDTRARALRHTLEKAREMKVFLEKTI